MLKRFGTVVLVMSVPLQCFDEEAIVRVVSIESQPRSTA